MKMLRRKDEEAVSPVIAIILMVAITVVLASVLYVWVMNLAQTDEDIAKFPTIEVDLKHASDGDTLSIKHTQGDPIDWAAYKIIITSANGTESTTMLDLALLGASFTSGDRITITGATGTTPITDFDTIDYLKGKPYNIEIYNLKENKRVYNNNNVICE